LTCRDPPAPSTTASGTIAEGFLRQKHDIELSAPNTAVTMQQTFVVHGEIDEARSTVIMAGLVDESK
jgi:hypothetical protein